MNQTYYFNRIFSELFDIEVRLMELENIQLDYKDAEDGQFVYEGDALGYGPKNMLEEIPTKPEFDPDLFVYWLLML